MAQGAAIAAVDATTVTVTPTALTKVGDTIYTVVADGVGYTCVASPDGTVTSFERAVGADAAEDTGDVGTRAGSSPTLRSAC